MKTIRLPYESSVDLTPLLKQYSSIVRYSYNRFLEGKTERNIRALSKSLQSIDLLNSWLIQCAIRDAKSIYEKFGQTRIVFGGKKNLIARLKNKITKEEFSLNRIRPLSIEGGVLSKGNRLFDLNIEKNEIIFKLSRNKHIILELPNLRKNIKNDLLKLQHWNESVKYRERGYKYSIRLDLNNICISFEEFCQEGIKFDESKYLGIDLNPDTIGVSVLEKDRVIHTQEFSLKPIFNKILNEKLGSNSDRMKYFQNKLKHETLEISKSISLIAKRFNCKSVFIEDLNFKSSSTIKISNRKNKNLWKRELFIDNLTKRLNVMGIKIYPVNPAYSSFIGNLMYDYTDSVNASIEIARRGYEYRIRKNKTGFYPDLLVKHQWKEMATNYTDWKEFFIAIKNLKLKYRVSLNECSYEFSVFKQNSSHKSMVLNYVFYD